MTVGVRHSDVTSPRDSAESVSPAPRNTDGGRWRLLGACALLIVAGILTYGSSLRGAFVYDDISCIVTNHTIRSWESTINANPPEIPVGIRRRPVTRYSFAANYWQGRLDPWVYHQWNLTIHITAALVLFDLVRRALLLERFPLGRDAASVPVALSAALVWMVHPLQTESVTYVIQRCESLMGMFFLASVYCVLRGSQSSTPRPWYFGAIACCWLGMGCKEVMLTCPLVVLLFDRVFLSSSWRQVLRERWWVYLGFFAAVAWLLHAVVTMDSPPTSFQVELGMLTPWEYARTQPGVILHYLRLALWPVGLCFDYAWPVADTLLEIAVPAFVVGFLLAACLAAFRWSPPVAFLGISFFLVLAPSSSVRPLSMPAAEHRMYLPLASVVILGVLLAHETMRRVVPRVIRPAVTSVLLAAVTAWFGYLSFQRNYVYHSPKALWADVVRKAPHNPRAHNNLAVQLSLEGRHDEAIEHLERAISLRPEFDTARKNLAVGRRQKRESQSAGD